MAWTREPSFSNTGSVISSIFRNWEDFSPNWDSLSPQEDSELVGASSSELITFGHHYDNKTINWEDYNLQWDSFLTRIEPIAPTGFSRLGFEDYTWEDTIVHFEDYDTMWDSTFLIPAEPKNYLNAKFDEIGINFNEWDAYFGNDGHLWDGEGDADSGIIGPGIWENLDILWNITDFKNPVNWDTFHPTGAEVYTGPLISVTKIDYSYGIWEGIPENWDTMSQDWDSFSNQLESFGITSFTSTSNIVPGWDINNINIDWEDFNKDWESMYLGTE